MLKPLLPVLALCWIPAHADTIFYRDSGTFSALTPTTASSGPSETWAFSFQADSNSTVSMVVSGAGFDFAFSNFSYSLNGSADVITPTFIGLFSTAAEGGFTICFSGAGPCDGGLTGFGPQMYSGPESAPTLLIGAFTTTKFDAIVTHPSKYDRGSRARTLDFTDVRRRAFGIGREASVLARLAALGLSRHRATQRLGHSANEPRHTQR